MANATNLMTDTQKTLPTPIRRLLGRLKRRIRWYVWLEGLALAVGWIGLAYWAGLALDYLPVRVSKLSDILIFPGAYFCSGRIIHSGLCQTHEFLSEYPGILDRYIPVR